MLDYTFVPLPTWPLPATDGREYSRFKIGWTRTLNELERELFQLNHRIGSVELHTFHRAEDLRKDGRLRSETKMPDHPGVILKFSREYLGKIVAMQFATDRFLQWKDNVTAIVRGMEALRLVDRFGVTSGRNAASQYEGFKALPAAIALGDMPVEQAAAYLSELSGYRSEHILTVDAAGFRRIKLDLQKQFHPDKDKTGNMDRAVKLNLALGVIERHLGL